MGDDRTGGQWRRLAAAALVPAVVTFLFVYFAQDPKSAPPSVVGFFESNGSEQIDVHGGTRAVYTVLGSDSDPRLTKLVADELRSRGVDVVTVSPTSVTVDVPRVEPKELERWSIGVAVSELSMHIVVSGSELARRLYDHVATDPVAAQRSIVGDDGSWTHYSTDRRYREKYVVGPIGAVPTYLSELANKNTDFAPDDKTKMVFERLSESDYSVAGNRVTADGGVKVRSYLIERAPGLERADFAKAFLSTNQISNRPQVELVLTKSGGEKFALMTEANLGRKLAIVADDVVLSAPTIQDRITGGRVVVHSSGYSQDSMVAEAQALISAINGKPLAARLKLQQTSRVDVTVSKGSLSLVRALIALFLAMLVFVASMATARALGRFGPSLGELRSASAASSNDVWIRTGVTAVAMIASVLGMHLGVAGFDWDKWDQLMSIGPRVTVFELGLIPVLHGVFCCRVGCPDCSWTEATTARWTEWTGHACARGRGPEHLSHRRHRVDGRKGVHSA